MTQKYTPNNPFQTKPKEVNPTTQKPPYNPDKKPFPPKPISTQFTQKPLLKLEMYEPAKPKLEKPVGSYPMYTASINPNRQFMPGAFQYLQKPTYGISYGPNVQLPMQNVYNINLPGPTGGHVEMNRIYENILPGKENKLTANTLGERLQMYDYVRQILVKAGEGEDVSLDNEGHNSLMSYIKFMELNPTYYSPINANPYAGLSYGLLIYRSCFPIKLDEASQTIVCARDSIGLNIRLYALTIAEYFSYKFRQNVFKQYDVWRELSWYEYMRENVLKKKQSPNFPLLYCYFLCPNRKIDFFALKKNCLTQKDMLTKDYAKFVQRHQFISTIQPATAIVRPLDANKNVVTKLPDEVDPALQSYSGNTLILVTESPNYNIYQWASRTYVRDGIARKMISQGFYNADVWMGVIFQIVSALAVLQIHGIYIKDMTMTDNVYIKDLQSQGAALGYWKYVINGISYYIPNYGYLVMIDSNYKDIMNKGLTVDNCQRLYKIDTSGAIGKQFDKAKAFDAVFENYRCIINTNSFTKEHTQNNVNRPPESIMTLIEKMMSDPEKDLTKVLSTHFRHLMNNRIGTYLRKDTELPNIRDLTTAPKPGEMVIQSIDADTFKFALVEGNQEPGFVTIITKPDLDSIDYQTEIVRTDSLKQYSPSEKIEQISTTTNNLSEEALLETYTISS